jgi:uncharacterized protein GlcG (DUF336 family)
LPRRSLRRVRTTGPWRRQLGLFRKKGQHPDRRANFAIDKAHSAALFKRTTKAFEAILAAGGDGLRVLGVHGAVPVEVGIPLLVDGNIVGAIGVSGATSPQDGQCAKAGADDFK